MNKNTVGQVRFNNGKRLKNKNRNVRRKVVTDREAETFWKNLIICDKSKFNIFGSDGRTMVWRKPNQELKQANVKSAVKHPGGSVLVWGRIAAADVRELGFIEGVMNYTLLCIPEVASFLLLPG